MQINYMEMIFATTLTLSSLTTLILQSLTTRTVCRVILTPKPIQASEYMIRGAHQKETATLSHSLRLAKSLSVLRIRVSSSKGLNNYT